MSIRAAYGLLLSLLLAGSCWAQEVIPSDRGNLKIDPSSYNFGEVAVGSTAPNATLEVQNTGKEGEVRVTEILLRENEDFRLVRNDCADRLLRPKGSCEVEIAFTPQAAGRWQAQLIARAGVVGGGDDDDDQLYQAVAYLIGTGQIVQVDDPRIELNTGDLSFGLVTIGGSRDRAITVVNQGEAPLTITGVAAADLSNPFSVVEQNCSGQSFNPGEGCSITVRFRPLVAGDFTDGFRISSNDPTNPVLTVRVSGSGEAPPPSGEPVPSISASLDSIDFGSVAVGQTKQGEVVLSNTGSASLQIAQLTLPSAPFQLIDSCSGVTLAPGERCSLLAVFSPTAAGTFNSAIDIPCNDPARPMIQVTLHGAAAAGADPANPDDPAAIPAGAIFVADTVFPEEDLAIPFGGVPLGMAKRKLVVVSNIGTGDLQVEPITAGPISGQYTVIGLEENRYHCSDPEGGPRILRPRQWCSVVISFRPTAQTDFAADLPVASDDPTARQVVVRLSGAGVAASTDFPPPQLIHPAPAQINLRRDVTFRWGNCRDKEGKSAAYRLYCTEDRNADGTPKADDDFSESRMRVVGRGAIGLAGLGFGALLLLTRRSRVRFPILLLTAVSLMSLMLSCSEPVEDSSTATLVDLEPQTTYRWKVVAEYEDGLEMESQPQSFTTR